MKQYKPGQFVTINGKLARVTPVKNSWTLPCTECNIENKTTCICRKRKEEDKCVDNLPSDCYPKLIKQCGNQDKL